MEFEKININAIKLLIFEIARNNGASLIDIAKKRKIKYSKVESQSFFLIDMGLLDFRDSANPLKHDPHTVIRLRNNIESFQSMAGFFDNKELSRFMTTKYYSDNYQNFCAGLKDLLNEHKLVPLPDIEYIKYAIKNSPSNVQFFLINNDIKALESFHQRCISDTNEKFKSKVRVEFLKKYNMYIIWDNVIFGKIQEDHQNGTLLNPVSYYAGYLPLAKKTFEKLLEISKGEESGTSKIDSRLKKYLKLLMLDI